MTFDLENCKWNQGKIIQNTNAQWKGETAKQSMLMRQLNFGEENLITVGCIRAWNKVVEAQLLWSVVC